MKLISRNPQETKDLAKKLVQTFLSSEKSRKKALVISLEGELGTGKTTFTQGFAKALGIKQWIKSPTFIIMREHRISQKPEARKPESLKVYGRYGFKALIHIDCYRLKNENALHDLGIKDVLKNPQNIVLIEWGEKIKNLLPQDVIRIKFRHIKNNQREITVQ